MKGLTNVAVGVAVGFCVALVAQGGEVTLFGDDFESYLDGSGLDSQGGWVAGAGITVSSAAGHSGNGLMNTDVAAHTIVNDIANVPPGYRIVRLDYRSRVAAAGDLVDLGIKDDGSTQTPTIRLFGTTPSIEFWLAPSGAGWTPAALELGTWYDVRIEFDFDADTVAGYYKKTTDPTYTLITSIDINNNPGTPSGFVIGQITGQMTPAGTGGPEYLDGIYLVGEVPDMLQGTLFEETFDFYLPGTSLNGQGGWTAEDPGPAVDGTAGYAFNGLLNEGAIISWFTNDIPDVPPESKIAQFDFRGYTGQSGDYLNLGIEDTASTQGPQMEMLGSGSTMGLYLSPSGAGYTTVSIDLATWYDVRMVFDLAADTVSGYYKKTTDPAYALITTLDLNNNPGTPSGFVIGKIAGRLNGTASPPAYGELIDDIVLFVPPPTGTLILLH